MYTYTLQFNNPRFFVADNTLAAFLKRVKSKDPLAKQTYPHGKLPTGSRLMYIKTELTPLEIKDLIGAFVLGYDFLNIQLYNYKKVETKLENLIRVLESLTSKKIVLK